MRVSKGNIAAAFLLAGCTGSVFAQGEDLDSLLGPSTPADHPATSPNPPAAIAGKGDAANNIPAPATDAQASAKAESSVAKPQPAAAPQASEPSAAPPESAVVAHTPEAKSPSSNRLIEEIVVTATKREENNQDVPISISAFSNDKLNALGVHNITELPQITPGLTFTTSESFPQIFLRGVGSDAFLPSADSTVPIYLDGVALLAGHGVSDTLGRISRVEVIKGPQGTLFGRNSTGGAISIITPDPSPDFEFDVQQEIGNYQTYNTVGFVNVPIFHGLGLTVSAYNESHQTYVQNTGSGGTIATYSRGGRVKLVWHASDNLTFNLSGQFDAESGNTGISGELTRVAPDFALLLPQHGPLNYNIDEDILDATVTHGHVYAAGADWKLPWVELKAITSAQTSNDSYIATDYDGGPLPLLSFDSPNEFFNQDTAELQILSTDDTPLSKYFSWVAGTYYLEGNGGLPDLYLRVAPGGLLAAAPGIAGFASSLNAALTPIGLSYVPGVTGPITAVSGGLLGSRSISGYFEGTTHLSEIFDWSRRFNVITGARLDREARNLGNNFLGITTQQSLNEAPIHIENFPVPKLSAEGVPLKFELQWFPTDSGQIYASFSRGFTAPTYSTVNFFSAPPPVKPSRVDSYEIGTKQQLFDQSLTVNASIFYIRMKDLLTGFTALTSGGIVEFGNVPAAKSRGVEADVTWLPLRELDPGLALVGGISYLNAKYTEYPDGRGFDTTTGLAFGPPSDILNLTLQTLPSRNFAGNNITRTPHCTYNISINQAIPIGENSRVELNVATNYSSGYFNDGQNSPLNATPSFQLVGITGSYFYTPWGVQISGFVKNLTKALYPESVFLLDTGRFQTPNDPRTYGLRVKISL